MAGGSAAASARNSLVLIVFSPGARSGLSVTTSGAPCPAENVAERFGAQAVVHRQERDTGQRRGEHRHGEGGPVAAEEDQAVDTLRCEAAAPAIALSRIAAPVRPAVRSPRRTRSAIPSATMSRIIARFIGISRAPFLPH
ncbi:hypothetical protein [Actinomadura madurae]|uniref:hypothetical protein n=1 Tax=Actinomadura madurae TaxID=1993 RepID=UPI0020D23195|nr:hypothetical protein [Actinomadura madurae]MCQ0013700.1 hypothetical protein [Actinomadura madurae]